MTKVITMLKSVIQEKQGVIVLPLKKWREIEEELEDLEMYRSITLTREITERRRSKKVVSLENFPRSEPDDAPTVRSGRGFTKKYRV